MVKFQVLLNTVDKVKEFVQISARYPFEIDLSSGRYVVDGKSIMGIFSFDLHNPVEVRVLADNADEFIEDVRHLMVDRD